MFLKRIQLGLIHVAVAMTLVPINSTLNRVMVRELALSSTLVAVLASLPYLFSPIQVAIGSFADRHPILGRRRSPYIVLGLLFCLAGLVLAPAAAFGLAEDFTAGLGLSILVFGAWGMGFNFATVSYFSLASELSGRKGRSGTIAIMFFMMILGIIGTAALLEGLLTPYSPELLVRSFGIVAALAALLGGLGIFRLEPRSQKQASLGAELYSWRQMAQEIFGNRQAALFFWYLILLLVAILGQDLLLEPYGAEAFDLSVGQTTRLTRLWGISFLVSLVVANGLERRVSKRSVARSGALAAVVAFLLIVISGFSSQPGLFYLAVIILGLATGLSTVSNLSLMLDMTTAGKVGLFIGAWGMANALARLTGNLLSGAIRDLASMWSGNITGGYQLVFLLEAGLLILSLMILRQIKVDDFKHDVSEARPTVVEAAALAGEM